MSATDDHDILAVQREILVELRGLRGDLRRILNPPSRDEAAGQLVRMIVDVMGDHEFTSAELTGAAAISRPLRLAIEAFGAVDARRLGKTLQGIEGRDFDGKRVCRLGSANVGAIWAVRGSERV